MNNDTFRNFITILLLLLLLLLLLFRNLTGTVLKTQEEAVRINDTMSTLKDAKAYSTQRRLKIPKKII